MQTDNPKSENIINVNNIHFSFKSVKYSIISNISQPNIFQTFFYDLKSSSLLDQISPWPNIITVQFELQNGQSGRLRWTAKVETIKVERLMWTVKTTKKLYLNQLSWPPSLTQHRNYQSRRSKLTVKMGGQNL